VLNSIYHTTTHAYEVISGVTRTLVFALIVTAMHLPTAADNIPATPEPTFNLEAAMRHTHCKMGEVGKTSAGPWGAVKYTSTMIEPPDSILGEDAISSPDLSWDFTGINASLIAGKLHDAGLSRDVVARLMENREINTNAPDVVIHPPDDILLGMDPVTRYRVYSLLRNSNRNKFYMYPFQVSHLFADEWFQHAALSDNTRSLLLQLIYRHGETTYFSDVRFVLSRIKSATERRDFFAALLRQPTLMAIMNVRSPADVDGLVAYWGTHGRESEVRPILEAASRGNLDWPINIILLLPSFPRDRFLMYDLDKDGTFRDCGWSALNFFNQVPDDRFLDSEFQFKTLRERYEPVTSRFLPGDVILFRNQAGTIIHMCNYIADNLVFTKNGGNNAQPWIFTTLRDVIDYYSIGGDQPDVLFLREKS